VSAPDAEAYGYALLLTRRLLTQALAGADDGLLDHRPSDEATAGETTTLRACAQRACERERWWIWPRELPAPQLPPPSNLADLLYALVRHRTPTEELLMTAEADDLAAAWYTAARQAVTPKRISLADSLHSLAREELQIGNAALDLRAALEPNWSEPPDLRQRAAAAVARLAEPQPSVQ